MIFSPLNLRVELLTRDHVFHKSIRPWEVKDAQYRHTLGNGVHYSERISGIMK